MTKFYALEEKVVTNDNVSEDAKNLHEWLTKQDMFSHEDALQIIEARLSK